MNSPAATAILGARAARRILAPLGTDAPADPASGYAVQHEIAAALGAVPPAGFKIGATTKQMQSYLGLTGPAAGFVQRENLQAEAGSFRFADLIAPGVECEVGLRLGADLPFGPCTRAEAAAAVAEVFAAIEIVEKRYNDLGALGTPTLIADQVFHRAGVLGRSADGWQAADLGAIRGRVTVDGVVRGQGVGADLLGHPFEALAWLAASPAASVFGGLKAGQVVFLGSVTPPIWLDGPCQVTVEFDVLGKAEARFA
jgi:2-keto-4-pentenoate hydratase